MGFNVICFKKVNKFKLIKKVLSNILNYNDKINKKHAKMIIYN
jgi:hypothetical protein